MRLLYLEPNDKFHGKMYSYEIDGAEFLGDQMLFDPRMEVTEFTTCRSILKKLGYDGEVRRSSLYDAPHEWIVSV